MSNQYDFFNRYTAFLESGAKEFLHKKLDEPHEVVVYMECGEDGFYICLDIYDTYSAQDGLTMRTVKFTPSEFNDWIDEDE